MHTFSQAPLHDQDILPLLPCSLIFKYIVSPIVFCSAPAVFHKILSVSPFAPKGCGLCSFVLHV